MKEKPTVILHFSGRFILTASLRERRMSEYISLYTVAITVNYTSEFRESFEATAYHIPFIIIDRGRA